MPINGTYFGLSFRLSEAYLNLAEAAAKDDDETTALWALNELRRNRFADYDDIQSVTGEELVTLIRQERRNYVLRDIVGLIYVVTGCLLFHVSGGIMENS